MNPQTNKTNVRCRVTLFTQHWGLVKEGEGELLRDKNHLHIEFIKDLRGPVGLSRQRLLSSSSHSVTMPPLGHSGSQCNQYDLTASLAFSYNFSSFYYAPEMGNIYCNF